MYYQLSNIDYISIISKNLFEFLLLGGNLLGPLNSLKIHRLFLHFCEVGLIILSIFLIGLKQPHDMLKFLPIRKHVSQFGLELHLEIGLFVSYGLQKTLAYLFEVLALLGC